MMIYFHNADMIALNETHLWHTDTLTPDMIGLSQDRLIVCCDHNNRGGRVALVINRNLNPKHIRMETILEIVVVQINVTNANNHNISLQTTINTTWCVPKWYVRGHCTVSKCPNMSCWWLEWRCINYIKYPLLYNV